MRAELCLHGVTSGRKKNRKTKLKKENPSIVTVYLKTQSYKSLNEKYR